MCLDLMIGLLCINLSSFSLWLILSWGNVTVGSMDSGNMGMQRYHDSSSNRSSSILQHPPPLSHRHHNQHVAPPMQGLRGHNLNFNPQGATAASYRLPASSSRSTMNPSQNGLEIGRRQPGSIPSNGFRIYRPHQGVIPEAALRHQNLPHFRVLQADVIFLSLLLAFSLSLSLCLSLSIYIYCLLLFGSIWCKYLPATFQIIFGLTFLVLFCRRVS